ncbi:MAG: hypothetical protein PHY62_03490 [Gallionella sp.]|nr:hypothetical protein [Gallionella sp.]
MKPDQTQTTPILPGATRMTATQATDFMTRYTVVDHRGNDDSRFAALGTNANGVNIQIGNGSGLSATLLQDAAGNYTLAIRSTEYADVAKGGDWDRDGYSGADGELGAPGKGFAFAQITALEEYYQTLKASGVLPANATLNVTGYSLGGHIASVFAEMHPEVAQAYVFNAAGHGSYDTTKGGLTNMMADFKNALTTFQANNSTDVAAHLTNIYGSIAYQTAIAQVNSKYNMRGIALSPGSTTTGPLDDRITQLFGHGAHNDAEYVSNSGTHTTATPVFIEDQPDIQGAVFDWAASLAANDATRNAWRNAA